MIATITSNLGSRIMAEARRSFMRQPPESSLTIFDCISFGRPCVAACRIGSRVTSHHMLYVLCRIL